MLNRVNPYAVITTARVLIVQNAESAIENNNLQAYIHAEIVYNFLNRQIAEDSEWSFVDARIPHKEFPEWPAPSVRPVFSDEEIDAWPVAYVEVDDVADVPF